MKHKLLTLCGAVLCACTFSSCYVYDSPLTWVDPCPRPVVYGRGFYNAPVYRSYNRGYCPPPVVYHRPSFNRGCAPTSPVFRSSFGHRGRFF
jgi:hypothetical protein